MVFSATHRASFRAAGFAGVQYLSLGPAKEASRLTAGEAGLLDADGYGPALMIQLKTPHRCRDNCPNGVLRHDGIS